MPDTITTFHTFIPNTTALSAQVNVNFGNFRGDLLPINENTATADDNTFDLCTTDRRCANAHIAQTVNLGQANTTGGWRIQLGATNTALLFQRFSSTTDVTQFEMGVP